MKDVGRLFKPAPSSPDRNFFSYNNFFNRTRLSGEVFTTYSFLLSLSRTPTTLELRRQVSIISLQPPLQPKEPQHSDVCWKMDPPLSGVDVRTFPPQPEEAAGMKSKMVGRGGGKEGEKRKKERKSGGIGAGEQLVERANINGS